jgi:hypothetical protein
MLDSKLHFYCHVNYVYSQTGLSHVTYNLSSLDSLIVLYNALIRSKLVYASVL